MKKELIERLREKTVGVYSIFELHDEAADLIEQQQSWIASLEQNARDADRLYKELETELAEAQKRIDELEAQQSGNFIVIASGSCAYVPEPIEEELAAAQAHIKVLRDALEKLTHNNFDTYDEVAELAFAALAQPTDDSALRELLKAERERCAQLCDSIADADPYETNGYGCAAKIRAMEDQ